MEKPRLFRRFPFKLWLIVSTLTLVLQACSLPSAPYDIYVAVGGNDSNNCRSAARACLTVQAALNKAVTGSVIHVGAGTFSSNTSIEVAKFVTIQGAGESQTIFRHNTTDALLEIRERITATLKDVTLQGGGPGLLVYANAHLIGDNMIIRSSAVACIANLMTSGRVDLTNTGLSQCATGIQNRGVFNGNHLIVQSTTSNGIMNWGAMTLQNTSVSGVSSGAAVVNSGNAVGDPGARLTFTHGRIVNNSGAGLSNAVGSTATITASLISGNRTNGVENYGVITLENAEVESNGMTGLFSTRGSDVTIMRSGIINNGTIGVDIGDAQGGANFAFIQNSTFSGNGTGIQSTNTSLLTYFVTAAYNSIGVRLYGGRFGMLNSIVELNTSQNCEINGDATINANAESLACNDALTNATLHLDNPTLETGTTVIPLLTGSTAIDHANDTCPPEDQRGYGRPHGAACDVGAYETGSVMALEMSTPENSTPPAMPESLLILTIITPTVTATPMQGVLEIVTPTPVEPATFTLKKNAFCRKGPDAAFPDLTALPAGEKVDILNISEDGFWYFIYWKKFNAQCWVAASTGDVNGDATGIQVLVVPTLSAPAPGLPPASPTPSTPCNPLIKVCP